MTERDFSKSQSSPAQHNNTAKYLLNVCTVGTGGGGGIVAPYSETPSPTASQVCKPVGCPGCRIYLLRITVSLVPATNCTVLSCALPSSSGRLQRRHAAPAAGQRGEQCDNGIGGRHRARASERPHVVMYVLAYCSLRAACICLTREFILSPKYCI